MSVAVQCLVQLVEKSIQFAILKAGLIELSGLFEQFGSQRQGSEYGDLVASLSTALTRDFLHARIDQIRDSGNVGRVTCTNKRVFLS